MIQRFEVELLEEAYNFLEKLDVKAKKKILKNMRRAQYHTDPRLFKKLDNEIWEFRTLFVGKQYRFLAFWDKLDKEKTLVFALMESIRKQVKQIKRKLTKQKKFVNCILKISSHEEI